MKFLFLKFKTTFPIQAFQIGLVLLALLVTPALGQERKATHQGIDDATLTAYKKLGAEYYPGGEECCDTGFFSPSDFYKGSSPLRGLPTFVFRTMPRSQLPGVSVPFGLHLSCSEVTHLKLNALAGLDNMVALDLWGTPAEVDGLAELTAFKNLHSLSLLGVRVTDGGFKDLARLKNLIRLTLHHGPESTNARLKDLASLKKLTTLCMHNSQLTDAGLKELACLQNLSRCLTSRPQK